MTRVSRSSTVLTFWVRTAPPSPRLASRVSARRSSWAPPSLKRRWRGVQLTYADAAVSRPRRLLQRRGQEFPSRLDSSPCPAGADRAASDRDSRDTGPQTIDGSLLTGAKLTRARWRAAAAIVWPSAAWA